MELNFNFWDWSMKSIVVMENLSSWLGLAFDFVEEGKCSLVLCNNYMWADEIVELCSCQLPNWPTALHLWLTILIPFNSSEKEVIDFAYFVSIHVLRNSDY